MEQLFIYMAKASGLIAVFFAAYYVFLKKETFFVSNRWFLLSGLITSLTLPLLVLSKVIVITDLPEQTVQNIDVNKLQSLQNSTSAVKESISLNWPNIILGIYLAGVCFLTIKLLINFISLNLILKNQTILKEGNYKLINTCKAEAPFSFFNYIVYNSAVLQPNELENIICHEKVHSRQFHSIDMLIGQLFTILFWFNPFAWLYKKSISQNLEFIADAEAVKQISDKRAYQEIMLKMTIQPKYITVTNHFYQSLIKKRIIMLNKKQSNKTNAVKYSVVLPALAAFTLLFQVETVAQSKTADNMPFARITKPAASASRILIYDMYGKQWYAEQGEYKSNVTVIINGKTVKNGNATLKSGEEIASVKVEKKTNTLEITTKKAEKAAGKGYNITIDTMPKLNFICFNKYNVQELETLVLQELKELK